MLLGNLLSNAILHLEQVSRESLESMMIPWDSGESGDTCELVKFYDEFPTNERL